MKANQNKIFWNAFYEYCEHFGFDRFVDAMNAICVDYLGLEIKNKGIIINRTYTDKVLEKTLYGDLKIYNKGGKWTSCIGIISNVFCCSWTFREIT